jgi:hypothetical protein
MDIRIFSKKTDHNIAPLVDFDGQFLGFAPARKNWVNYSFTCWPNSKRPFQFPCACHGNPSNLKEKNNIY